MSSGGGAGHPAQPVRLPAVSVPSVTTVPSADPADRLPVPPLFDHLVDDTSLLAPRADVPEVDAVVTRYLATRDGRHGGLLGTAGLPGLAAAGAGQGAGPVGPGAAGRRLAGRRHRPGRGAQGAVDRLLPLQPAHPPHDRDRRARRRRRGLAGARGGVRAGRRRRGRRAAAADGAEERGVADWLDAVRRVAGHGCTPKLRCGGSRPSDVPSRGRGRAVRAGGRGGQGAGSSRSGALPVVTARAPTGPRLGVLNLLVAAARALARRRRRRGAGQHGRCGARPRGPRPVAEPGQGGPRAAPPLRRGSRPGPRRRSSPDLGLLG